MIIEGIILTVITAALLILYPSYKLKEKRKKLVITSPVSIFSSRVDQSIPKKKKQKKSKKKLKKMQSTNSSTSPGAAQKEVLKNDQQSEREESEDQQKVQIKNQGDVIIEQQIEANKQQQSEIPGSMEVKIEIQQKKKTYTVIQEIDMIRHYFILDLQELMPYNGRFGHYRLTLEGPNKILPIEWKYSQSYPKEPLQLKINRENLKPFEIEILDRIIQQNIKRFISEPHYMLIFQLATKLFQELLIHLNEQISQIQVSGEQQGKVSSLPSELKEFNLKVAHMKPQQLKTKKQIYGKILDQIFYLHDLVEKPDSSAMKIIQTQEPLQIKQHNTRGRYQAEFQQLQLIGQGGFGKVYRVRHKLDGNIYAIKKAVVNYEDLTDRKMLKEVALLSKLNHPNIVRYYQSWLEDAHSIAEIKEDMSFSDNEKSKIDQLQNIYAKWKNDRSGIRFARSNKNHSYSGSLVQNSDIVFDYGQDSGIVFEDQESGSQNEEGIQMGSGSSIGQQGDYCEASDASLVQGLKVFPFKILYIAMQCCSGINLREFINRHFIQEEHKVQILRGILEGLSYIHGKKIIHRDLKPANIFLTDQNKVKIGDFGLATCQQRSVSISFEPDQSDFLGDKTKAVGTGFYRAPQQLKSQKYDEKVDIYSLGIIILELFHQFNTAMQRTQSLKQITSTHRLPKEWSGDYSSDIGQSIQLCLQEQAERRPSAGKLLQRFRNKYFTQLVSCIANPKHFQFSELLSHLFAIKNQHGSVLMRRDAFKPYLSHALTEIYRVHGAVHFPTLPLISAQDSVTINGLKLKNDRSNKFLLLTNRGIVLQYTSNCLKAWLIYIRDAMRKRKGFTLLEHKTPFRRYTFEKVVNWQHKNEVDDPALCFHQKMVSAFDLTYRLEDGFNAFYLCEALRVSQAIVATLHLTQRKPPIFLSHSQLHALIAKKYNVPLQNMYKALLSIDEVHFSMMPLQKRIAFLQALNLPTALCKKISNIYEMTFQKASDLIQNLQIEGFDRILQEMNQLDSQTHKVVRNPVRWRLGIPYNCCHGFFWEVGIVKGLTSIEQYALGQELCNYHVQIQMDSQIQQPDVSLWCIGQYLQEQMQRMICQCWKNGLSTKWYEWQVGEKEDHCRHNIILRRKNDRVQVMHRHNQVRKGEIGEHREERQSSFISIQQFNVEVIKQMLAPHHYYY